MKPQLAEDALLDKVRYPCWFQPKIDGVRALNLTGQLTGRSLDPFKGYGITEYFSGLLLGGDGEMTLGDQPNSTERLCSLTTGAMGKFKGVTEMPDLHWWLFDLVSVDMVKLPYADRYLALADQLRIAPHSRMHLVPVTVCDNRAELDAAIVKAYDENFEGGIIRNPNALYKEGRATKDGQELWRVKAWQDDEILVTELVEGNRNENEAKTNTLGRTERSSAKAGKVPNGLVGSLKGTLVRDVHSLLTGKLLFPQGLPVEIGAGEMDAKERKHYFENPKEIVGHIVKFKHLAHGTKDLPRMGTFKSLRLKQDMS